MENYCDNVTNCSNETWHPDFKMGWFKLQHQVETIVMALPSDQLLESESTKRSALVMYKHFL
jgi:hypothetical protein